MQEIVNNNRLVKEDIRMNKNIFIRPFIVVFCLVFCGCEKSSKHSPESPAPPPIPSSRTLTLSQQQLVFLDWHSPNRTKARVMGKRVVSGQGVEFDIYFPGNVPDCTTIHYVSSGQGGRGALIGADVKGYEKFALAFTLVSINGQTEPNTEPNDKKKVEIGALIGPTPTGGLSDYKPVILSLSEKSKVAVTPMRTNNIYQIGFYIRLLEPQNWSPTGSEMVLRIEPVENAGFVPWQTTDQP